MAVAITTTATLLPATTITISTTAITTAVIATPVTTTAVISIAALALGRRFVTLRYREESLSAETRLAVAFYAQALHLDDLTFFKNV